MALKKSMDLESKVKKVREVGERLEDLRAGCRIWVAGRPGRAGLPGASLSAYSRPRVSRAPLAAPLQVEAAPGARVEQP